VADILVPLNGHVRIRAWEKQDDGTEIEVYNKTIKNLIVDAGKQSILKYIGNISGGGYANQVGVGDSTTAAASAQTDLQASSNKYWKSISSSDRILLTTTLYLSVDFGYTEGNYTWNELGLRDNNNVMYARQIDGTPFVKTSSKRAIVEWQLSL
tara:strand:+ start:1022 stop:1483 length:462 start_codon:yes stop_codon:yes gene_type:complete